MDQLSYLFLLCAAMFLGAFGSGYIPLSFTMSENKLRLVTIFGAGLLVGTALIVVIPEGIAMHYEGQLKHAVSFSSGLPAAGRMLLDAAPAHAEHDHSGSSAHEHGDEDITHEHPGHWRIGAALALGFAFQLIVGALLCRFAASSRERC